MAPPRIHIPSEILERARALYENGEPVYRLGKLMGVSAQTVLNRAREYGWSRERLTRPVAEVWPDAPPPMNEPAPGDLSPHALRAHLQRLVGREMIRAETYNHSPAEAARTLAMLSKIVVTLNAPNGAMSTPPAEDEEVDIDAFRIDVANRLNALMDQYAEEAERTGQERTQTSG